MIPSQTIALLYRQLGRVPSLTELYAALGLPNGPMPGDVAQDPGLTGLLREEESVQSSLIRMILFGAQPAQGAVLGQGRQTQSLSPMGPGHILPHRLVP